MVVSSNDHDTHDPPGIGELLSYGCLCIHFSVVDAKAGCRCRAYTQNGHNERTKNCWARANFHAEDSGADEGAGGGLDFAPDPLRHDDAGHVRAELAVGGEAHGVAAEEAEEFGVGFGAVDEGVDAAWLGEEASLDGDGVAEFAADFGLPGGLVAGEGFGGEVGLGGVVVGFGDGGEDGGGGEVARDHGEVDAFGGEGVDHAGGVAGEEDAVGVGRVEGAGDGDGEGAVVFRVGGAGGEAAGLHVFDEGEVVLAGATADVFDEVVGAGAEAEVDVVLLGEDVAVAVA